MPHVFFVFESAEIHLARKLENLHVNLKKVILKWINSW